MSDSSRVDRDPAQALAWEIDIPIATHPVMLANFALLFAISGLLLGALLSFILAMSDVADAIEPMWEYTAAATAALFLLGLLVATIIFGNRLPMRFALDAKAAQSTMTGSRSSSARRAAHALSWIAGTLGLAGAGLIAETSTPQNVAWSGVAKVHFHPLLRTISLSNGWRTVLILFCTPENYAAVAAAVHTGLAARRLHVFHNPLPQLLLRTFLILLSSMPLFALPYVEKIGVFPALLILCFALAAVWLERRFAWLALAGLAWSTVLALTAMFKSRDSIFGGTFRAFRVLESGDLITLALALAGAGYLAWLFLSLLRGEIRSGLAGELLERERDPSGAGTSRS